MYVHIIVYVYVYMHMSVFIFLTKKRSLEHVPSMMCTVPSVWPSTMVESSILYKSVDMTDHTAEETA